MAAAAAAVAAIPSCSIACAACVRENGASSSARGRARRVAVAFAPLLSAVGRNGSAKMARTRTTRGCRPPVCRRASAGGRRHLVRCSTAEGSPSTTATSSTAGDDQGSWVKVIPYNALPRGERRLVRQAEETILLLWYKDDIFALENTSPAEGAYSEGFFNARLTPDGCIVCPSTETTFDLKTGEIKDWYPTNPVLAFLTRPTRPLTVYPVKTDGEFVYVDLKQISDGQSAEIVFGGQTQAGKTATDVSVDEVRMVVEEGSLGFGFTSYTELVNGRAAMVGVYVVLLTELVSGQGFLKGLGFLDFLYKFIK